MCSTLSRFLMNIFLFLTVFHLIHADKRYCGAALTKTLMNVCEATDCSQLQTVREADSHIDEISTRCCRFGCTTRHMQEFCCLTKVNGDRSSTETSTVDADVATNHVHTGKHKNHSRDHYKNLKLEEMKKALEKWASIEIS